jgi:hypothetical protein
VILVDEALTARFWAKVNKAGDCWVWTGARNPYRGDYGIFWVKFPPGSPRRGVTLLAHRVSWEIANGPIPGRLLVCHTCDNPPCVRPAHLFLGSDADNQVDMIGKGRRARPVRRLLTDEDRAAILALRGTRSGRQIAREFDVDNATVVRIFQGADTHRNPLA